MLRPFNRRKHTLISRNSRTHPPKQKRGETLPPLQIALPFPRLRAPPRARVASVGVPALRRLGFRLQRGRGQRGLRTRWLGLESGPCHRGGHRRRLGLQRLPRQDLFDLLALQALPLEQRLGQAVQSLAGPEKSIARPLIALIDDPSDFLVDLIRDFFTVVTRLDQVASQEHRTVAPAQGQRSKFFAHSEFGDHLPRQFRSLLEIVLSTGRDLVEN